jgi:pimeloyl-ACP methyl ester carboxylesterase
MNDYRFIKVNDFSLEVKRWPSSDQGPPILLLHEGLGSISMWRDFPAALAKATGREVIAWSRQGYGKSDPLKAPRDPDYMHLEASIVPEVMSELGISRAWLFGHSDGGSIALLTAALFPEIVAGLILEAPHVYVEQKAVDSIAKVKTIYETTDLGQKLGRHHADVDHVFWHWNDIWLDPRFRAWNIEAILPGIAAPTLVIQGHDDEYGTMDQLDRIDKVLPQVQRLELNNCGHSPHRDQAEGVISAAASFMRSIDP